MTATDFRIWFLCTLLVVGLMPMPAVGASHGCCDGGQVMEAVDGGSTISAGTPAVASTSSCCQPGPAATSEVEAPCGSDSIEDADCDGCCEDGGPCRCPRCGCSHPGPAPAAVRTPSLSLSFVAPAAAIRVPVRQWTPGGTTDSLLRPPRH